MTSWWQHTQHPQFNELPMHKLKSEYHIMKGRDLDRTVFNHTGPLYNGASHGTMLKGPRVGTSLPDYQQAVATRYNPIQSGREIFPQKGLFPPTIPTLPLFVAPINMYAGNQVAQGVTDQLVQHKNMVNNDLLLRQQKRPSQVFNQLQQLPQQQMFTQQQYGGNPQPMFTQPMFTQQQYDQQPMFTQLQYNSPQLRPPPPQEMNSFDGLPEIIRKLGKPDLTDPANGGIAIWSNKSLRDKGYPSLRRVEILDEKIICPVPVSHVSNIYVWVSIDLTNTQLHKVIDLSPNIMYDQKKKCIIVRSNSLDGAVAVIALIKNYSSGKISMYQIYSNNLLKKYYLAATKGSDTYDKKAKLSFYKDL